MDPRLRTKLMIADVLVLVVLLTFITVRVRSLSARPETDKAATPPSPPQQPSPPPPPPPSPPSPPSPPQSSRSSSMVMVIVVGLILLGIAYIRLSNSTVQPPPPPPPPESSLQRLTPETSTPPLAAPPPQWVRQWKQTQLSEARPSSWTEESISDRIVFHENDRRDDLSALNAQLDRMIENARIPPPPPPRGSQATLGLEYSQRPRGPQGYTSWAIMGMVFYVFMSYIMVLIWVSHKLDFYRKQRVQQLLEQGKIDTEKHDRLMADIAKGTIRRHLTHWLSFHPLKSRLDLDDDLISMSEYVYWYVMIPVIMAIMFALTWLFEMTVGWVSNDPEVQYSGRSFWMFGAGMFVVLIANDLFT